MRSKYDKYYDFSTSLVMGVILIVIGIILLLGKEKLYKDIVSIVVLLLLLISIFNLLKFLSEYRTVKENSNALMSGIFYLAVSLLFVMIPNLSYALLPFLFAMYLLIISISNLVMYFVFFFNRTRRRMKYFLCFLIYFSISLPILVNPVHRLRTFLELLSIYIILLGVRYIHDFLVNILSVKVKNRIKRGIRITLPKIFESIIPYSVMCEINSYLEMESEYQYVDKGVEEANANMYIIVHTSSRGVNKMGHLDIYFDHKVISYGNYDEGSRKFLGFGDGVLFECNDLYKYINFCIDYSKKTIFLFGLQLSEGQREKVMEQIHQIRDNVYDWDYRNSKIKDVRNSYAARLAKKTKAHFYKFRKGKYKTYYVLGTNCCYLVDDIVGKSGFDILSLNGIVTPGTYYDYLNRELYKKNSIVVSKQIYNEGRRPFDKIKK